MAVLLPSMLWTVIDIEKLNQLFNKAFFVQILSSLR
jgi:hypothetical protein